MARTLCWLFVARSAAFLNAADFAVTNTADGGAGSLRQAIIDSNLNPGSDRIVFAIAAPGVQRINVGPDPLPAVTDPVRIDGYTQPGATPNDQETRNNAVVLVELHRRHSPTETDAENYDGLLLQTANCTVRGLAFTGFRRGGGCMQAANGAALILGGGGGHHIEGNFIGMLPDGRTTAEANEPLGNLTGIMSVSPDNFIGGTGAATRNIISGGADASGIVVQTGPITIQGNYIGTDATGTAALKNNVGILLADEADLTGANIGGRNAAAANVISGNTIGIYLLGSHARVEGNVIGLNADRSGAIPNGFGVQVFNGRGNAIGDLPAESGNLIAFNHVSDVGIAGEQAADNRVLSNRTFANE